MKSALINFLTGIQGLIKRILRLLRVFLKQKKSIIKYVLLGIFSVAAVFLIIFLMSGEALNFSLLSSPSPTATLKITSTPTSISTATPIAHIYGNSPLVILDSSSFKDNGYIEQVAKEFNTANNLDGQYIKVDEGQFINTYKQMVLNDNTPNVVIAPNDLILQLGKLQDISKLSDEILFNKAALGALKDDKLPIALSMYGYFFRVDLLYVMTHDVPREYDKLLKMSKVMRSDNVYSHLKHSEEDEVKKDRKDEFLTSRYGFGFPGGDVGGQLFIKQAMAQQYEDETTFLHDIKYMWEELYLPPDTAYSADTNMINAFMNDALVGVFAPATLFEELIKDTDLYYNTQVKPYLGRDPIYTANVIYCAVPETGDIEVATNFLSKLYNGGNLDKIIVQNHLAYLPVSLFYNQSSPWIGALNENTKIIYYEDDVYIKALKHIILAGEDVEDALAKSYE